MRKLMFLGVAVGLGTLAVNPCFSLDSDSGLLERLSQRFQDLVILSDGDGAPLRFLYADAGEHVHAYEVREGKPVPVWEATGLGSKVNALIVRDVDADGRSEIVIATSLGRVIFHDAESYDLVWENHQDPFGPIDCMITGNIDRDPQDEVIFVADSHLFIFDALTKTLEWRSQREFDAKEMVLGNVDDDGQLELILNTGVILDTRFYNVEFESEVHFGRRISLLDLSGDGIPEVIGETGDFTIRIFDVYAEREIW